MSLKGTPILVLRKFDVKKLRSIFIMVEIETDGHWILWMHILWKPNISVCDKMNTTN